MDNSISRLEAQLLAFSLRSKERRNMRMSLRAMMRSAKHDRTTLGRQYADAARVILHVAKQQSELIERLERYAQGFTDYLILPEEAQKWMTK